MNNTKRILGLVLSVVLVLGALVALSSCKEHEHEFAAEWSTDATNHWHAATCEHTEEKGDLGAHADADNNGTCDVCNYAMSSGNNNNQNPTGPEVVTYTVVVKNKKGEAVRDVKVRLIAKANDNDTFGDYIPAKTTDAEGKVTFDVLESVWFAQVESAPDGYASAKELDETLNLEFVKKYAFGDATTVEIVLEDAPAQAE